MVGGQFARQNMHMFHRITLDRYLSVNAFVFCGDRNINVYGLCDLFYSNLTLCNAYSKTIYPLGDPEQWHVFDTVLAMVVLLPRFHRKAGKPRVNCILPQGNARSVKNCRRCKLMGYNWKTCTFSIAIKRRQRGAQCQSGTMDPNTSTRR